MLATTDAFFWYDEFLGNILLYVIFADKSLNANGHQAHQIEPINNFELSPVSASEDDIEVVGARSNKNDDDVDDDDDDDPESKRRCLCSIFVVI